MVDKDLDAEDLGGIISWTAPSDVTQVLLYVISLATDHVGSIRLGLISWELPWSPILVFGTG